jgi:predicted nuclease of predicted toxin-antitoxin system
LKLLLDQHISYKLVDRLADLYPGTSQVRLLRLEKSTDSDIWYYAKANDFVIVTKDRDIVDLGILRGSPPKIVWLRVGNLSTDAIEEILRSKRPALEELLADSSRTILEILD